MIDDYDHYKSDYLAVSISSEIHHLYIVSDWQTVIRIHPPCHYQHLCLSSKCLTNVVSMDHLTNLVVPMTDVTPCLSMPQRQCMKNAHYESPSIKLKTSMSAGATFKVDKHCHCKSLDFAVSITGDTGSNAVSITSDHLMILAAMLSVSSDCGDVYHHRNQSLSNMVTTDHLTLSLWSFNIMATASDWERFSGESLLVSPTFISTSIYSSISCLKQGWANKVTTNHLTFLSLLFMEPQCLSWPQHQWLTNGIYESPSI